MAAAKIPITTKNEVKTSLHLGQKIYDNLKVAFFDKVKNGEFFFVPVNTPSRAKVFVIKVYNGKKNKVWDRVVKPTRSALRSRKGSNLVGELLHVPIKLPGDRIVDVQFKATGKDHSKIESGGPTKTSMQENVSLLFIKKALNGGGVGKTYDQWEGDTDRCVVNDKRFFRKIVKTWPDVVDNTDWQESFMAQSKKMLDVASRAGWDEFKFDRDKKGGFMKWIENIIITKYKIIKPDSWNPADIWMIKDETDVRKKIKNAIQLSKPQHPFDQIGLLNEIMQSLFISGDLIGVSLKLVTKPKQGAFWKVYNVEVPVFESETQRRDFICTLGPNGKNTKGSCFLALNFKSGKKPPFATQELKFWLYDGSKKIFEYVVKGVSSVTTHCNMKLEPKDIARSKAFMGKSPVPQVRKLMHDLGIGTQADKLKGFDNNHNSFPRDLAAFLDSPMHAGTKTNIYAYMWSQIKDQVTTNINSEKEFMDNMTLQYSVMAPFAQQKLMMLNFIYVILNFKERDKFLTTILAFAEKFGDKYGPFGKLY